MDKEQQLTPQQKHQIWMKNSGYLYDRLVLHKLKWPSLTFQWLPTFHQTQSSTIYQCLFASHTSGQKYTQHIYIAQIQLPNFKDMEDQNPQMIPSYVRKIQQFNYQNQINKARYWQFDPSLIAARTQNGPISIFRRGSQYPQFLLSDVVLGQGFALQWSNYGLVTGDHNGIIAFWQNLQNKPIVLQYRDKIQDTKFFDQNTISTVSDDGFLCFWDIRTQKLCMEHKVSDKDVYCHAINPENKCLILTGGQDSLINLWDIRNINQKLFRFESHQSSVLSMQWSPKTTSIFASGSQDCKVKIWDLLRVGFQIPKDNSGTDELLFTHEGHLGQVTDLCWNRHNMLLGSTQEVGNTLQFYEISNCIQDIQYTEDIEYLRSQCLA